MGEGCVSLPTSPQTGSHWGSKEGPLVPLGASREEKQKTGGDSIPLAQRARVPQLWAGEVPGRA